ncbi:MAG: carbohydrate binding family 9 domain-containing protein [Acidobacteriota bacterium]|nr:carbohydrate binding family 9 domain-containing protein [Acidobacteriota bacterium]
MQRLARRERRVKQRGNAHRTKTGRLTHFGHFLSFCTVFLAASLLPRSVDARTLADEGHAPIEEGVRTAVAVRVQRPPRLDGTLNDPLWQRAKPVNDFRQREPYEGQPSTERTTVRILYTRNEVYFGIRCNDSDPKGIVATQLVRDASQDLDDYFQILIDPTNDHRDAYLFQINPLGTQLDGLIVNEGDIDTGWNGIWTSDARMTSHGWTATVGIPFSTLNFMKSKDVVWGLNFERFIRRKNEEDLWSAWRRAWGIHKVSQAGELTGITDIGSGRLFIVKPYALAGADSATGAGTKALHTAGVDIKYGLRSNLILDLTGNTDFAEAEADQLQFNLTPYKLYFPETRQFFLENAGIFSFPMGSQDQLFFSRQIGIDAVSGQVVPVNGGAKLTGIQGKYQIGAMDVDTRSSGPNPYANYAVARVTRSLFGASYVGVMAADKRSGNPNDRFNQAGGVDTRLVFLKNLTVQAWAAQTRSPGVRSGNTDVGGTVSYKNDWMQFEAERVKIGPNFNPEVGFVNRTDANESFLNLNLAPRPKIRGLRELNFEGFIDHIPDTEGVLQTQEWQATFRAIWNNGAYTDDDIADVFTQRITTPFNIYKNIVIPPGMYHFVRHQITFGSRLDRPFTYQLYERFGSYYGGRLNEFRVKGQYRPNEHFSFALVQLWNSFRLPEGNFSVDLASLQASYSFSRFLTFTSLVQMDTANTQAVNANLILQYRYRPDSDVFVIYNAGTQFASLAAANPQQFRESRFEVKFTYSYFH